MLRIERSYYFRNDALGINAGNALTGIDGGKSFRNGVRMLQRAVVGIGVNNPHGVCFANDTVGGIVDRLYAYCHVGRSYCLSLIQSVSVRIASHVKHISIVARPYHFIVRSIGRGERSIKRKLVHVAELYRRRSNAFESGYGSLGRSSRRIGHFYLRHTNLR